MPTRKVVAESPSIRYAPVVPELIGGSADLTPAPTTPNMVGIDVVDRFGGRDRPTICYYGVREFGMSAVMQRYSALHGGFIPYGGTFLVVLGLREKCCCVCRRLMGASQSVYVYTHDSIRFGEKTVRPINPSSMLASLRLIPEHERLAPL